MAIYSSTNELIASIKSRTLTPTNQSTFKTADFLRFLNEELFNAVLPRVLQVHEDHYLISEDTPLESGRSNYRIPYRAVGNKIRDVSFRDINKNVFEMTRISVGDISFYQGSFTVNQFRTFFVRADEIVIVPAVGQAVSGHIEFSYYMRPNKLVTEDRVGKIVSIDSTTGTIVLDAIPSNFSTSITLDFIQVRPPHKIIAYDVPVLSVNVATKTITVDPSELLTGLGSSQNPLSLNIAVGDHVLQSEETIIPQIPPELHSLLAHRAGMRCLEALGDAQGIEVAKTKLAEMEFNLYELIDNRVEEAANKVTNRHSPLRQAIYGKRYRRRGL